MNPLQDIAHVVLYFNCHSIPIFRTPINLQLWYNWWYSLEKYFHIIFFAYTWWLPRCLLVSSKGRLCKSSSMFLSYIKVVEENRKSVCDRICCCGAKNIPTVVVVRLCFPERSMRISVKMSTTLPNQLPHMVCYCRGRHKPIYTLMYVNILPRSNDKYPGKYIIMTIPVPFPHTLLVTH